ncbi:MAG: glycine oxidase ThiO [Rhizomicrobium sp.]|nr:glycine oxidase ThiO [Rhizomicrobium sp.]
MKVVIIGAGVAGLAIGWKLAVGGAKVVVLERAQVGNGATLVSGGMLAATAELGSVSSPDADFARQANALWPDFAAALEAQSGFAIGYRRNGALLLRLKGEAARPEGPLSGERTALTADAARQMEPLLGAEIENAIFAPHEAQVDSQALCRALAVCFVQAGGEVRATETAVRFELTGGRVTGVVTPFTTHRADAFVIAAGAWSARIEGLPPEAVPPVVPVKGEIIVLSPPAGVAVPSHVVWGNGVYIVPRRERVLVGATMELAGFDTSLTKSALTWLRRQAEGLMPSLKDWRLSEHWAGLRPAAPDGLPLLGQSVDGLFVASGQYRNGILFAPAVADVLSRLILERIAVDPAFDPRRFAGTKSPLIVPQTPHKEGGNGAWPTVS